MPPKDNPTLRIKRGAWAKLLHMLKKPTEVGFMGVAYDPMDPLLIDELALIKQEATGGQTEFDDEALARWHHEQIRAGRQPLQYSRVWIHTHPGGVNKPSGYDEEVFKRVFGDYNWAVMMIVTKEGTTYARLRVSGPGVALSQEIPILIVDNGEGHPDWDAEYDQMVQTPLINTGYIVGGGGWRDNWRNADRREINGGCTDRESQYRAWQQEYYESLQGLEVQDGPKKSKKEKVKKGKGPLALTVNGNKDRVEIPKGSLVTLVYRDLEKEEYTWSWDKWEWTCEWTISDLLDHGYRVKYGNSSWDPGENTGAI